MSMQERLRQHQAELDAALLRAARMAHDELNGSLFRRKLRTPTFALIDAQGLLGRWNGALRTLEIQRRLLLDHPWGVVLEVLKHEMAHQYVAEVLGVHDEAAHGPAFREVCAKLAIDPAATGLPEAGAPTPEEQRVLERIAKLLALAESPNEHEARAAMGAAQKLMLRHNLERPAREASRGYAFRHLGAPTGRISEHERLLATILSEHFFVETIWVPVWRVLEQKRGSVLEVCGTPANLEMAAYVHAFLGHTADELWTAHKRELGIQGDRERRVYLAGVMSGFQEQLASQKKRSREEGLVWLGDPGLSTFYRQRNPHVRMVRFGGGPRTEAREHGRAAGRQIVLNKPVASGATTRGKLLGK
jgi:hypothetical protein